MDLQFFGYLQKNEVRTVLFWASLVCATHLLLFMFAGRFGLLNSAFSYVANPSVIVPVTATIIAVALSSPPRLHVMLSACLPIIIYLRLGFDIVWGTIALAVLLTFLIAFIIRCVASKQLPRW